jgi:class 3 adenylate cyclase
MTKGIAPDHAELDSQTRLSTLISGIVFWTTILFGVVSIGIVLYFTKDSDRQLRELESHRFLRVIEIRLQAHALSDKENQLQEIIAADFKRVAVDNNIVGGILRFGQTKVSFGTKPASAEVITLTSNVSLTGDDHRGGKLGASFYFPSAGLMERSERDNLVIIIGGMSMLFGLLLNQFLRGFLARPFNRMIADAKAYASGKKSIRFDEDRTDDFGFLSKFINLALQTSEYREKQLEQAVEQLDDEKRYVHDLFSHYLSPNVINRMIEEKGKPKLGGEVRNLTAWFSDLSGFTALSETLTPEKLTEFLNRYFSAMTEVVEANGGFVERYVGDSILAIFGTTTVDDDHARQAVLAGLECIEKLRIPLQEFGLDLDCRIGINTGEMMVGNIGSENRFSYTVMGDAANVGSRLEGANKQYGTHILVGEGTFKLCNNSIQFREVDLVRVVGRKTPVRIFQPLGLTGNLSASDQAIITEFPQALSLFRKKDFAAAALSFSNLADKDPVSARFAIRVHDYLRDIPPDNWDGVNNLNRK